jgi:ABC-type phosphate/phosphonate transport system substrate-binding protein
MFKRILIIAMAVIVTVVSTGCGESSSSSSSSNSAYCQFDGCTRKAVGPTYEFCSYHKDALNAIWDNE